MLKSLEGLREKGALEVKGKKAVRLKIAISEAFTIITSQATDFMEAMVLCICLGWLMKQKGFHDLASQIDAAFNQAARGGRLTNIPGPLPDLPGFESDQDLDQRLLRRLIDLEGEGVI
jgi:hypothetical protein